MLTRRITLSFLLALLGASSLGGCVRDKAITAPFADSFERGELGDDYHNTGGPYQLQEGKLRVQGAYNKPLWLKRALPDQARIELDVVSHTGDGDLKLELWGDGESYATDRGAYLSTGYVLIMGGWGNTISAIARLDEHGADRLERRDVRVERGKVYRWTIERRGSKLTWQIDGKPFLSFDDSAPLKGRNHAFLAFNNWQSDSRFDNLKITPLP